MEPGLGFKLVMSIILIACLSFLGFFGAIFTSLMGGVKFYTPLVILVTIAIIIALILKIFNLIKSRLLAIGVVSFFSLCFVVIIGYEMYQSYYDSLDILKNQEVDLYEYRPFAKDSKVVSLEEPSALKIKNHLPKIDGATALYPLYAAFAQATYPEKEYDVYFSEVMSNRTGVAYKNLMNGEVDIIFALGPSQRQIDYADQLGVELELTPIGKEAFVFFVNSRNPIEGLTVKQIQGIYSGKVENWREVGGKNDSIRAFQRPDDSGSQTALESLMGEVPIMEAPTEDIVSGMGGIIAQTAKYRNYKNALGYTFRFFSTEMVKNGDIRHLKIDGIYPDKENIRNGLYPLSTEFYAITAGSTNPHLDDLINWILSEQGQMLVEKTGYIPIKEIK
ncbi:PstS family phosphate ABC transporter substrate-binding protein [Bacillus sp. Marseille-P3661]|uniref:PstS family phosphate ABC transporter substrate-binding protein n=1 Tax=Bacillus sp. Marseille-P3661 TaxID=1936234 RepID=UPI0021556843|nr:substrate-binding domain-containing protein [Bacillus sp. Marseille-P3661]